MKLALATICLLASLTFSASAQRAPYDNAPPAEAPYFRVRYEASTKPGELIFAAQFTVWIPQDLKTLRGLIVHQHGCGEGSCKSGLTGAFDLHWQALAKKHDCALLAPVYEQPQEANCQMWCDPRNGSAKAFEKALVDLGEKSGHPELAKVPWALWGHSGGGHWCGGMTLLYPDRVAAAWLRSGVPLLQANPKRKSIKTYQIEEAALGVPIMCNLGTKEGVTVKDGRFAGVWPANETFFRAMRSKGAPIGIAIDPLSSHDCGNQRYLAIPWLDACLGMRLPTSGGSALNAVPAKGNWLAELGGIEAGPAEKFSGNLKTSIWLPNASVARAWKHYIKDTKVPDTTRPPAPTDLKVEGNQLSWSVTADLESGLAHFVVLRDGKRIATVPEKPKNSFGRPIFQGLLYSDTPTYPLVVMRYTDSSAKSGAEHNYRIIAVNTAGLESE